MTNVSPGNSPDSQMMVISRSSAPIEARIFFAAPGS